MQLAKLREQLYRELYNEFFFLKNKDSSLSQFFDMFDDVMEHMSMTSMGKIGGTFVFSKTLEAYFRSELYKFYEDQISVFDCAVDKGYNGIPFNTSDYLFYKIQFPIRTYDEELGDIKGMIRFPFIVQKIFDDPFKTLKDPKSLEFSKKLFELNYNQYSKRVKDLSDFFKLYALR